MALPLRRGRYLLRPFLWVLLSLGGWSVPHFFTADGCEVPAVTAEQMREIDRLATDEMGPNLFQMMENAGRSLALEAIDMLASAPRSRVVVLAGNGGNGGGGLVAARHLANRGIAVTVVLAEPERLGEIGKWQLKVFQGTTGSVASEPPSADLVIDALLGYSLQGAPRGRQADLIEWANQQAAPILSLDLPSGLDATTGDAPGSVIRAQRTLTLALPKTGLRPDYTGRLVLADLGIPQKVYLLAGIKLPVGLFHSFRLPLFYAANP